MRASASSLTWKTFVLPTLALQIYFAGDVNVVRPDDAPHWFFRTQISIVLPQAKR